MILGRKISKIVHYDFKSVQFCISLIIVNVYTLNDQGNIMILVIL